MKKIILLLLMLFAGNAFAGEKLMFAVDIIRHGDRMPVADIPNSDYKWPYPFGQLSPKGMKQEFELGSKVRGEYVERYGLLPAHYTAGTMYVRSSDIDRTLMSAQSFLLGLYPPGTGPALDGQSVLPAAFQPIPVHTVSGREETLLYPDGPIYRFDELRAKYLTPTKEWRKKSAKAEPKFKHWSEATGFPIKELYDIKALADTMLVRQFYKVPPPAGLSKKDIKDIIETGQWVFANAFKPEVMGRTTGIALLKQVAGYLSSAGGGNTALKYVLFSAHDSTILAELCAMGDPQDSLPPYASRLNFKLFANDGNKLSVKVSYNDKPVHVKGCAKDSCTLDEFMTLVK